MQDDQLPAGRLMKTQDVRGDKLHTAYAEEWFGWAQRFCNLLDILSHILVRAVEQLSSNDV
jgi:hypothetical protein